MGIKGGSKGVMRKKLRQGVRREGVSEGNCSAIFISLLL